MLVRVENIPEEKTPRNSKKLLICSLSCTIDRSKHCVSKELTLTEKGTQTNFDIVKWMMSEPSERMEKTSILSEDFLQVIFDNSQQPSKF